MERLIFHIDVNSAFLSWEATRRVQNGEPDIRIIPSCISGDPDKRTSVVLAKSIPAKRYGIKTGEPLSAALRKCPELYVAKPDFKLYTRLSKAFKDICRQYAPEVEEFSIDECFLDMTGTGIIYPEPIMTAYEISKQLFSEMWDKRTPLRLIGIALTKIVYDEPEQLSLFVDEKKERGKKIDKAVDNLRNKFGFNTIKRGSVINSYIDVAKKYKAQMEE